MGIAQAALNFKGGDTCLHQFVDQIDRVQIIHGKIVAGFFSLLLPVVTPPAWLDAAPAQTAFTAKVAAEQAKAGVTEAEGAVDKNLQFNTTLFYNSAYFLNRKLSSQHDAFKSHSGKLFNCQGIVRPEQSTGMKP